LFGRPGLLGLRHEYLSYRIRPLIYIVRRGHSPRGRAAARCAEEHRRAKRTALLLSRNKGSGRPRLAIAEKPNDTSH
jgi:hypothetical protein